ncbi:large subunit GTPase 1, putative [Plasmodium vinckei lentum]|uniref:Large subunit GTPase 1, putative n=1 Tax=Plasmodium vinckei lentum TaxID=138297 RepID=A0A6V7S8G6_PLAVN|nr:large subunit GTPase 1, putative [Plasmodium vinckei lentum]
MAGNSKKSKPKKQKNCMGRSLMYNKLKQKEKSDLILYSKIGYENEGNKNVSKQISVLNKSSIDDYLDNQLAISNVQVSKVFIQKNEIKEKKNTKPQSDKYRSDIQNIVLPIPGRPFFFNHEEKLNINLKKQADIKKRKTKRDIKHITFLMKGKHLMPINGKTSHAEHKPKPRVDSETPSNSNQPQPDQQPAQEPGNDVDEGVMEEVDEIDNVSEEEEINEVDNVDEEEEVNEVDSDTEKENETETDGKYKLKYMRAYEQLHKKYEKKVIKTELNKDKLERYELEHFVDWRKLLSRVEEKEGYIVTPYEKNIEYWKQLWRVIEKSHILFYIIDARNPLFFYSKGLEMYTKRVDKRKEFIVILNKSDFLTYEERKVWAKYFDERKIQFIFFSALRELYHQNQIIIEDTPLLNWDKNSSINNQLNSNVNNKKNNEMLYNESPKRSNVNWDALRRSRESGNEMSSETSSDADSESSDKSSDESSDKSSDESSDKSSDESSDKSSDKSNDKSSDKSSDESSDKSSGDSSDETYCDISSDISIELNEEVDREIKREENEMEIKREENEMEIKREENEMEIKRDENIKVVNTGYGNLSYEVKKNANTDILSVNDLINLIKKIKNKIKNVYHEIEKETYDTPKLMVGFIGFPNVGKSSVINSIVGEKKVGVSRQPGKTKHFQTIPLNHYNFILCDCPGIIFPSIVFNKHDLIINGVFSIDHYKGEYTDIVQVLCNIIPEQLCQRYKIKNTLIRSIQLSQNCNDNPSQNQTSTYKYMNARDFLHELCIHRKYISGGKGGILNFNFATRLIVRDFITGKLLYNFMPNYLEKCSYIYSKEMQSYVDIPEPIPNIDNGLSKASNQSEDVLITKRQFRYMKKRAIKGKNTIRI